MHTENVHSHTKHTYCIAKYEQYASITIPMCSLNMTING